MVVWLIILILIEVILIFNPLEKLTVICKDFRLQVGRLKLVLLKIGTFLQSSDTSPVSRGNWKSFVRTWQKIHQLLS